MTINKPMEHFDSSRICAGCVNKNCKSDIFGNDFMTYSRNTERYECPERMVELKEKNE